MLFARKSHLGPDAMRQKRVRWLFVTRHPRERTRNNVLRFFLWLRQNHPELLSHENHRDPYEHLKLDLNGLFLDE